MKVAIFDIGISNLGSLCGVLDTLAVDYDVITDNFHSKNYSHGILPGVGSFGAVMREFSINDRKEQLLLFASSGRPILGICLGMHAFFSSSEESAGYTGLNLMPGTVTKFKGNGVQKIPHIGWNEVIFEEKHPVLSGIKNGLDFYFVHSYHVKPLEQKVIIGRTDYGYNFPSIVSHENIIGVQFHPEKSQKSGMKIIKNFINWTP